MNNEDEIYETSVFEDIIVEPEPQPEPEVFTTADLVAIYSLIKAGYTAEDFS